jgi:hypothetical protein
MAVKPLLADTVKPLAIVSLSPGSPKTRYYQTILLKHADLAPLFLFICSSLELTVFFYNTVNNQDIYNCIMKRTLRIDNLALRRIIFIG